MLENDSEYLRAVAVGDLAKARGLENMDRLCAREPVYAAMVYVLSDLIKKAVLVCYWHSFLCKNDVKAVDFTSPLWYNKLCID